MARCENCGYDNGYRKTCPQCHKKICRLCQIQVGVFCYHGNVSVVSLEGIDENKIIAIKNYPGRGRWERQRPYGM